MDMARLPRLGAKAGDQLTLTTIQGQTLTGVVVAVEEDEGGGVVQLALQDDPARDDPVWVRSDLIALWRLGQPVHVPMVQQGGSGVQQVPVTPEMLRRLRGG